MKSEYIIEKTFLFLLKLFKLNATPHCTYSEKSICCSYFEKYKVNYLHKVLS